MRPLSICLMLAMGIHCQAAVVGNVRIKAAPDNTRVVLDISGPVEHRLFKMASPPRVVVDIQDARLIKPLGPVANNICLARIRSGQRNWNELRLVLDLYEEVEARSFIAGPSGQYGHRLVVDLIGRKKRPPDSVNAIPSAPAPHRAHTVNSKTVPKDTERGSIAGRDIVVAVDAGHGGEDPGAIGQRGTREKDVALTIARKLAARVEREPGMRAVLIRNGDYFVGLRDRMKKAREHKADLFVSIHADAVPNRLAIGSSVYVLSERGASNEQARWLAERENAADLVGGVSLDDKDDVLKAVLLDLSQTGAMDASHDVAKEVLHRLTKVGDVHYGRVQSAGFLVLKSPDIPSLLVETAYISNPSEERKLIDPRYQDRLASTILDGIRAYFKDRAPPGTRVAMIR